MRLSLCVISGNEAGHIERFLDSFKKGFDEFSLVRAIGSAKPDETEAMARAWCERNGKAFVFSEYKNADGSNFDHIDNFAAARNQSFSQATGDWLFWADCDDIIDGAAMLRELAASGEGDIYRLPYSVPQSNKLTTRERLLAAEKFRAGRIWRWPIHENLLPLQSDKQVIKQRPVFVHDPQAPKAGGNQRNLRILSQVCRDVPAYYYYLHQENFYLHKHEQARRFGELFLQLPMRPTVLEYQCLVNLSELSQNKQDAVNYAMRAHHLFPHQKESVAALVKASMQQEHVEGMLHWSQRLVETPQPAIERRLWCYEPKWDGWAQWDLRARALRWAGKMGEAAQAQANVHGATPVRFSLVHASRKRVGMAIGTRELWVDLAEDPASVEHIFAIDDDDKESLRWLKGFDNVVTAGRTCVAAWNAAAAKARGEVIIQLSDDWIPTRGWDRRLREAIGQRDPLNEPFVIAISDGHRTDSLLCMAICSRKRWEDQGEELFSPEYESMYSDNEFTHRAYRDGVVIDARDIVFKHMHPAFGGAPMDETYSRQNAADRYRRGLETFLRRNPDAPRPSQ